MATTSLHISLPEELKRYVQERTTAEAFSNPSDYVRTLIREDRRRKAQDQLETLLLEGLGSGEPAPLDEAEWAAMRAEVEARLAGKSNTA